MKFTPPFLAFRVNADSRQFAARLARTIVATMILAASGANHATADLTLAYSFESDLQGFAANGGGLTVAQDTIGATEGAMSMKVTMVAGATFAGPLTQNLPPEIGDPPGLEFVLFDLTITEAFPTAAGNFVDVGITIFGATQPDYPGGPQFGLQAQFQGNQVSLGGLAVGKYSFQMPLTSATHPLTFATGLSFNNIFGTVGSGPNDLIPGGFEIYINKSATAPWTGYFDNIRVGALDADFNNDTFVNGADLAIWKPAFGATALGDADGDLDSDGTDFLIWQRKLNVTGVAAAVPEPATFGLLGVALLALSCKRSSIVRTAAKSSR